MHMIVHVVWILLRYYLSFSSICVRKSGYFHSHRYCRARWSRWGGECWSGLHWECSQLLCTEDWRRVLSKLKSLSPHPSPLLSSLSLSLSLSLFLSLSFSLSPSLLPSNCFFRTSSRPWRRVWVTIFQGMPSLLSPVSVGRTSMPYVGTRKARVVMRCGVEFSFAPSWGSRRRPMSCVLTLETAWLSKCLTSRICPGNSMNCPSKWVCHKRCTCTVLLASKMRIPLVIIEDGYCCMCVLCSL